MTYPPCPYCRSRAPASEPIAADGLDRCCTVRDNNGTRCVDRVRAARAVGRVVGPREALAVLGVRYVDPSELDARGHRVNAPSVPDPIGIAVAQDPSK